MKLGISHYDHKSIADAKFESASSSNFGDMTSQTLPQKNGTSHQFRLFTTENGFNFLKRVFMSRFVLLDPKLTPMSILAIFKQRKIFSFCKFLGRRDEKRAAATLLIDQFC